MESTPLVLTDPNLLAEFARESEFKTFFEKRFATPPDLAAILFRDGELIDGYKGAHFSVGGLWENIKGVIGGSHHYALLLADLKPFPVQFPVKGMSVDNVEIAGVATLELQLNPDKPSNILGLMGGVTRNEGAAASGGSPQTGRKALTRFDVLGRIEPHFQDRVFDNIIGRHNAEEIRGNRGLQDQLQADMMQEAERICGDIGLMVKNGSITWAMNEVEREEYAKAQMARQQEALDYQLENLKREVARQGESTQVKIQATVDEAKLKSASEDELRVMVLNSEVAFVDAREGAARRQEGEALQHAIAILGTERAAKFANDLQDVGHSINVTNEQLLLRKSQLEIDKLNLEHGRYVRDIEFETRQKSHLMDVAEAERNAELARKNLAALNEVELAKKAGDVDIDIKKDKADTDNTVTVMSAEGRVKVDQMLAAGSLSAEQLAQVMPGLSAEGAQVAIARAQAEGMNATQTIAMVEKLTADSREHEHRILETGMKGGTGMAAGLGGAGFGGVGMEFDGSMATVECPNPKCHKVNPAKVNFCTGCGQQLRT